MLCTRLPISSARLIGSLPASSSSRLVLKRIKSVSCSCMNCWNSVELCLRAKESGSSPSGRRHTLMFMRFFQQHVDTPDRSLDTGCIPVVQYGHVVGEAVNQTDLPGVSAVPEEATTFSIPDWCMDMTSVWPSTRKQRSCFTIACLAK